MFSINQSATFTWPVVVTLPADGGKTVKNTFDVEFRRMTKAELKPFTDVLDEPGGADNFVRSIVLGWKGIVDDGAEVPFSADALDRVLDIPGVTSSIMEAYREAISGEARRKN